MNCVICLQGVGLVIRIAALTTEPVYQFLRHQLACLEPYLGALPYSSWMHFIYSTYVNIRINQVEMTDFLAISSSQSSARLLGLFRMRTTPHQNQTVFCSLTFRPNCGFEFFCTKKPQFNAVVQTANYKNSKLIKEYKLYISHFYFRGWYN